MARGARPVPSQVTSCADQVKAHMNVVAYSNASVSMWVMGEAGQMP